MVVHIQIRWTSKCCHKNQKLYFQPRIDPSFVFLTKDFTTQHKDGFPLFPKNDLNEIQAFNTFPASVPELLVFCKSLSDLLEAKAAEHGVKTPIIALEVNQDMDGWLGGGKYFVDLDTIKELSGTVLQARVNAIADAFLKEVYAPISLEESQISTLNDLPSIDRQLVLLAYETKGCTCDKAEIKFGKAWDMSYNEVQNHLKSLLKKKILNADLEYIPILATRKGNGDPATSWMTYYVPNLELSNHVLDSVRTQGNI